MEILLSLFVIVFIVGMMLGVIALSFRFTRVLRKAQDNKYKDDFRRRHLLKQEVMNDLNYQNEKW